MGLNPARPQVVAPLLQLQTLPWQVLQLQQLQRPKEGAAANGSYPQNPPMRPAQQQQLQQRQQSPAAAPLGAVCAGREARGRRRGGRRT